MVPMAYDIMIAYARRDGHAPGWVPLPIDYVDYTLWQRQLPWAATRTPTRAPGLSFEVLAEHPVRRARCAELPWDRPRPVPHRSLHAGTAAFTIGPELHRKLRVISHQHDSTMFMVMHAALAVLLARLKRIR